MRAVNIMIKPASSACNMACKYCFYRDIAEHRSEAFKGMLSLDNLEHLVASALSETELYCGFAFQGGEPTLAGLDFFRHLLEFQKKHNTNNIRIQNSLQTNGLVIDQEWAEFLAQNNFLVGLSLDGPADVHNANRPDTSGKDTFNRIMSTMHLFREKGVEFNILSVVTGKSAKHIASTYRFFTGHKVTHLQFIPCLEPLDEHRGDSVWHLSPDEYGKFLVRLFDAWFADLRKGSYTSIRHIDNQLSLLLGNWPEACNMTGRCTVQFVVEGDGGVYPCDFYVHDQWRLGSVEQSLTELQATDTAKQFVDESLPVPEECKACRWGPLCRNGCKRDRVFAGPDDPAKNYYCSSFKHFFDNRYNQLREASAIIAAAQRRAHPHGQQ